MQPNLRLYHYWRSSCSWRLRWALILKGLRYESIPINLLKQEQLSQEYLSLNPLGTVPLLEINAVPYSQSMAIIEWLDETYPEPRLIPSDPLLRLKCRELSLIISADTQPIQNLKVQQQHSSDPNERQAWARHWINEGLKAFETRLSLLEPHKYCLGDTPTLADLALIPQCYNAERFGVSVKEFPKIEAIYNHALKTPSCEAAAPHNQPGAL